MSEVGGQDAGFSRVKNWFARGSKDRSQSPLADAQRPIDSKEALNYLRETVKRADPTIVSVARKPESGNLQIQRNLPEGTQIIDTQAVMQPNGKVVGVEVRGTTRNQQGEVVKQGNYAIDRSVNSDGTTLLMDLRVGPNPSAIPFEEMKGALQDSYNIASACDSVSSPRRREAASRITLDGVHGLSNQPPTPDELKFRPRNLGGIELEGSPSQQAESLQRRGQADQRVLTPTQAIFNQANQLVQGTIPPLRAS